MIGPAVQLGDGCRIGSHVVIEANTSIGPGCRVHANAVLGDHPQDLGFHGGETGVRIGGRCTTQVGEGCLLMANCHLAHDVQLGDRVIVANGALLGGHVQVGDSAFLSGM